MTSNKWKAVDNIRIKFKGLKILYNVKGILTGALYDILSCLCISYNSFFENYGGKIFQKMSILVKVISLLS